MPASGSRRVASCSSPWPWRPPRRSWRPRAPAPPGELQLRRRRAHRPRHLPDLPVLQGHRPPDIHLPRQRLQGHRAPRRRRRQEHAWDPGLFPGSGRGSALCALLVPHRDAQGGVRHRPRGPPMVQLEKDGIAFWLKADRGMLVHCSGTVAKKLFPLEAFVWYSVDVVYDVAAGLYDLKIRQEGGSIPSSPSSVRGRAGPAGLGRGQVLVCGGAVRRHLQRRVLRRRHRHRYERGNGGAPLRGARTPQALRRRLCRVSSAGKRPAPLSSRRGSGGFRPDVTRYRRPGPGGCDGLLGTLATGEMVGDSGCPRR